MRFKEWMKIQEVGTSTSCIAGFSRMTIPLVTRKWPSEISMMFAKDPPPKNIKMQPQVKEHQE